MRTKDYDQEEHATAACVDWKDNPQMVLEQVDEQLACLGLEIVMLETGSDSYVWTIETRQEE